MLKTVFFARVDESLHVSLSTILAPIGAGKLLVCLLCYAICLCYADGVCFIISCVAYRIFHYRRVGNFASCVIMGDNSQANVHCRFADENDLSHLNI